MKDWSKWAKEFEEKFSKFGEALDEKLGELETEINDKVQVYVTKFVEENEKKHREKADKRNEKPVYEYRANGFVTRIFKDGTKTVTPEEKKEESSAPDEKPKEKTKGDKILGMLPFLDEDSLHELTVQFIEGDLEIDMKKALSFLEEEDVSLLMKKITENNGEPFKGLALRDVLPFANSYDIGEMFKKKAKQGIIDEELINFVDDDCWHDIVKDYCENENSELDIDKIYPHLDEDDLKLLFKTYLKRQK